MGRRRFEVNGERRTFTRKGRYFTERILGAQEYFQEEMWGLKRPEEKKGGAKL